MSWLYSRALVAAYSPPSCSAGEPSAPSSATPTPPACYSHDRMTARWPRSLSGMTCEPLTADRGAALLTSFLAAFRARTYLSPAQAPASTARAQDCGASTLASWARYDRDTSAWKTRQLSLLEDSTACSATWPRWGTMLSGECWERTPLERLTGENGSGSSPTCPTPTAGDAKSSGSRNTPGSRAHAGVSLTDFVRDDGGRGRWPTPNARDHKGSPGAACMERGGRQSSLPAAVAQEARRVWPTPTASEHKYRLAGDTQQSKCLNALSGGALNPEWVEWLMGWPLGWTDLGASATVRCRSALPSHSPSSPPALDCQSVEMLTSLHSRKSKAKTAQTRAGRGAQPPGPQTNRPPAIPTDAPPVQ